MKKNILFILSVLIFSVSFVSCDNDEDNDDIGSNLGTINLFIDGNKMNTNTTFLASSISYDKPTITFPKSEFSIMIIFGDDESQSAFFNFKEIDFEKMKVGDDLLKLCKNYGYQVTYQGNQYWLHSDIDWFNEFAEGKGKFIVKELNAEKTIINIEFQDIKLPILKGSQLRPDRSKMIDIKGNMKYEIDFH